MINKSYFFLAIVLLSLQTVHAAALPPGFVYLRQVDPSIIQEIRYAGPHNFIGRPIRGYQGSECILTRQAADAMKQVQAQLKRYQHSLKVYDCYRPQMAVNDFIAWSQQAGQRAMKKEFYPRVKKSELFKEGYIAARSGHSRGSTVDLTIVKLPPAKQPVFQRGNPLQPCYAPQVKRFGDNSIDMGTGFDCLDKTAHIEARGLGGKAKKNRLFLRQIMKKYGFMPYDKEWWHFTLRHEPFKKRYFSFAVIPIPQVAETLTTDR